MANSTDHGPLAITTQRMFESLKPYIVERIHPIISERLWSRIIVRGNYARRGSNVNISSTENRDKSFNWHRPTAIVLDNSSLEIACFPGRDYVQHYATMAGYYFALNDGPAPPRIEYYLPPMESALEIFFQSNLRLMGDVDTVVLGCVEFLAPPEEHWETGTEAIDQIFAWKTIHRDDGHVVSYLACMISLWGDILGDLIRALRALNNVSCVLYMGKAGSLRPTDTPNEVLVTGGASYMDGKLISWDNALKPVISIAKSTQVCSGINVTVPTPLIETNDWFSQWEGKADWVDCEVGHAAQACQEGQLRFGYLHIISDNVARYHPRNLSTGRQPEERLARGKIFSQMQEILALYSRLNTLSPGIIEGELYE